MPLGGASAEDHRKVLKVALLGCGTVGSQVARILLEDVDALALRSRARLELTGIAVRDRDAVRDVDLPHHLFTADAEALVDSADVTVELIGGIEPARSLIQRAIRRGASVVTGNKVLLAQEGSGLLEEARRHGAVLSFEAAVAGAIPIVRPLRESLAGDRIIRVTGILNGTTNYILDQMDRTGVAFEEALAEAQRLGYAEADPRADVEGHDAAAKAALLAALAFHTPVRFDDVSCHGIAEIAAEEIAAAKESGFVIKLLATAELRSTGGEEEVSVRVAPVPLPREHPLGAVYGANNAILIEAENAGRLMFHGAGAGGRPSASAIMGDLVSIARRFGIRNHTVL
jgi:homoserine dehydrogenase